MINNSIFNKILKFSGINPEVYSYTEYITKKIELFLLSVFMMLVIQLVTFVIFFIKVCEANYIIISIGTFVLFFLNLILVKYILNRIFENLILKKYLLYYAIFFIYLSLFSFSYLVFYHEIQIYIHLNFIELPSISYKKIYFLLDFMFYEYLFIEKSGAYITLNIILLLLLTYIYFAPYLLILSIKKSNYNKLLSLYEKFKV